MTARDGWGVPLAEPAGYGTNNRIATAGFAYDAAGNLTLAPMNDRYAYDGENRQIGHCTLDAALCPPLPGSGRTQYGYDGEGRRVTKTSLNPANQTVEIVYAYDARGRNDIYMSFRVKRGQPELRDFSSVGSLLPMLPFCPCPDGSVLAVRDVFAEKKMTQFRLSPFFQQPAE